MLLAGVYDCLRFLLTLSWLGYPRQIAKSNSCCSAMSSACSGDQSRSRDSEPGIGW